MKNDKALDLAYPAPAISTVSAARGVFGCVAIVSLMILCGCGGGDDVRAEPRIVQRNWTPLPSLPPLLSSNHLSTRPYESLVYEADLSVPGHAEWALDVAEDGRLEFCPPGAGDIIELQTDLVNICDWEMIRDGTGAVVLMLVGDNGATPPAGRLQVYRDADKNGVFTSSESVVSLLDTSPPVGGSVWISATYGDDVLYILDKSNSHVLSVVDADSDGIPDSLLSTPFADSTQTHEFLRTLSIAWDEAENCLEFCSLFRDHSPSEGGTFLRLRDSDSDGRADEFNWGDTKNWEDDMPPVFVYPLDDGWVTVYVRGPENATIQLWQVDPVTGTDIALRGASVHPVDVRTSEILLPVPPIEGEAYVLRDTTNSRASEVLEVGPVVARAHSLSVDKVSCTAGATITVTGSGFASGVTAVVIYPLTSGEPVTSVAISVSSTTEAIVTIPSISASVGGRGLLQFWLGGERVSSFQVKFIP